jgi:zinc transport system substrate-binding protein
VCSVAAVGCGGDAGESGTPQTVDDGRLTVAAVNYPLAYFAARIGADLVAVDLLPPPGVDPAFWQPSPDDIARIQASNIILLNGADYAKWVATATLPASRVVVTADSAWDRYITIEGAVTHTHGPEAAHSHGETAFTTWLDPRIAIVQAEAVAAALVEARPEGRGIFDDNLGALVRDLEALDESFEDAFSRLDGRFIASHPVYQYLARRYDLDLVSVTFEPDQPLTEAQWRDLQRVLAGHPASVMLWESEPLPEIRERLSSMGLEVIVLDPAANRPESGDYMDLMGDNVDNLGQVATQRGSND